MFTTEKIDNFQQYMTQQIVVQVPRPKINRGKGQSINTEGNSVFMEGVEVISQLRELFKEPHNSFEQVLPSVKLNEVSDQ